MAAKTWDGGGITDNWSDGPNWNGDTVPATTDPVTFDATSPKNCTIDALGTWSGGAVTITAAYGGVITKTVAMTCGNFSIAGGTWDDTSGAAWTSTATGTFSQTGGSFTCTSATMTVGGNFTCTSGTFVHNSGTVKFTAGVATQTIDASAATFNLNLINASTNNVTIQNGTTLKLGASPSITTTGANQTVTLNGTLDIASGTLTFTNGFGLTVGATGTMTGATDISIGGSLTINASSPLPSGITWTFKGTRDQTITATAYSFGTCTISLGTNNLIIAANTTIPLGASPTSTTTGAIQTITVNGTITIASGTWTLSGGGLGLVVPSGGTISGVTDISAPGSVTIAAAATFPDGVTFTFTVLQNTQVIDIDSSGGRTLGTCIINGFPNDLTIAAGTVIPLGANPTSTLNGATQTLLVNGTIQIASGVWTLSGGVQLTLGATGTIEGDNTTLRARHNVTINPAATIPTHWNLIYDANANRVWDLGSKEYGNFRRTSVPANNGTLTIVGSNTFDDWRDNDANITHTILFTPGTVQKISTWTVNGAATAWQVYKSTVDGQQWRLSSPAFYTACSNFMVLRDSVVDDVQGFQGVTGERPTGIKGITGTQHPTTGVQGITGVAPQGIQGLTGVQGITGIQGITGARQTGMQGVQGVREGVAIQVFDWNQFTADDSVAVESGIDNYHVMPRFGTILEVLMSEELNGTSGTTIADVFRGTGTLSQTPYSVSFGSIFTTAANRPMIGATPAATNLQRSSVAPDLTEFSKGDVFSVDVVEAATGAKRLKLQMVVQFTGV